MINESDRWLSIDLRHLAALQAVAEERSFHRAAERLGYTQSAVSQQIAALERIVDTRLIDRPGGPRTISLTEAGEMLLLHAGAILARAHAAEADLAGLVAGEAGALRVGTYQSVGRHILPPLMRRFSSAWPRVEVRLTESGDDDELLLRVERGELDLTFAVRPIPDGPFETVDLLSDPYVLMVPADSPLAGSGSPELRMLADLPLIGYWQCRTVADVEGHLRQQGIEPNIAFRSQDNGTVQALVAAGVGSALVPRLTVDPSDESVAILDLDADVPPRRIVLAWHRDRYRSAASSAFIDMARTIGREVESAIQRPKAPALVASAGR